MVGGTVWYCVVLCRVVRPSYKVFDEFILCKTRDVFQIMIFEKFTCPNNFFNSLSLWVTFSEFVSVIRHVTNVFQYSLALYRPRMPTQAYKFGKNYLMVI